MRYHRVQLAVIDYEALQYFAMLRGLPLGSVLNRQLHVYSEAVQKEFPPVRAHVMAKLAALGHDVELVDDTVQHVIPF